MNRFHLNRRLLKMVKNQSVKLGIGLAPSCQHLLEQMVANGVDRMVNQDALEREEQIYLAERNLRKCILEIKNQANLMGTLPVADEKAFEQTIIHLCPIWPFC